MPDNLTCFQFCFSTFENGHFIQQLLESVDDEDLIVLYLENGHFYIHLASLLKAEVGLLLISKCG